MNTNTSLRFKAPGGEPEPDLMRTVREAIRSVTATGQYAQVTVSTFAEKRSDAQNRAWHAMLGQWAQGAQKNAVELKQRIKYEMGEYTVREICGERFAVFNSSTKWSKATFAEAMERTAAAAAAEGVVVGRMDNWQDDAA